VKPYIWIAAIGVIGDYAFEECKELLEECKNRYPQLLKKKPLESELSRGVELISSAITLKGSYGSGKALDILQNSVAYEEFSKNTDLQTWSSIVNKEFKKILEEFEMNRRFYPDINLMIYEIKSRLNLTSAISTKLAEKNPDKTILIKKKSNGYWKLSFRNQSGKLNLGELVKKCVQEIGYGGGHEKSAGAIISNWGEFKERFIKALREL
jgi:single-stranded DNA-specific DHH superfamily exonuclease